MMNSQIAYLIAFATIMLSVNANDASTSASVAAIASMNANHNTTIVFMCFLVFCLIGGYGIFINMSKKTKKVKKSKKSSRPKKVMKTAQEIPLIILDNEQPPTFYPMHTPQFVTSFPPVDDSEERMRKNILARLYEVIMSDLDEKIEKKNKKNVANDTSLPEKKHVSITEDQQNKPSEEKQKTCTCLKDIPTTYEQAKEITNTKNFSTKPTDREQLAHVHDKKN